MMKAAQSGRAPKSITPAEENTVNVRIELSTDKHSGSPAPIKPWNPPPEPPSPDGNGDKFIEG